MVKFHRIDTCNTVNGRGCRVLVWFSGCPHHCKACFSPQTWNPEGGQPFTLEDEQHLLDAVSEPYIDGITFCGGEPLAPYNVEKTTELAKKIKAMGKTVWCYSGYYYHEIQELEVMEYTDVLIDGRFNVRQFNPNLKWRGSANQRLIDVQKTRELNEYNILGEPVVVLHPDNNEVTEYFPEQAFDPCKGMTRAEIKEKYIDNVCNEGEL